VQPCTQTQTLTVAETAARNMSNPDRHLTTQPFDFWLARGAIAVIVGLQIGIVNDLTVGPRWLAPCLELALLIPL
jgi:hypothetical protein